MQAANKEDGDCFSETIHRMSFLRIKINGSKCEDRSFCLRIYYDWIRTLSDLIISCAAFICIKSRKYRDLR